MLPVSFLLNPIKSEPRSFPYRRDSYSPPYLSGSSVYDNPLIEVQTLPTAKQKMSKDGAVFSKGKVKGEVNFPPFENLEGKALQEVQKYRIYPLGKIEGFCRHIPYNSEKKSFLEKTGRESFEVFQYEFKLPGEEKVYTVMWDYNVGLVRITPFFKCCKYSKTTPAKMLSLNSGLKEITHSITGGALAAQGYWMPYSCALAVCATFCDHISGALIPIFGPTFPSRCISITSPTYGRMIIDPTITAVATTEANSFRNYYASATSATSSAFPSPSPSNSGSPRERLRDMNSLSIRGTPPPLSKRLRLKHTCTTDNIYNSDSDTSNMGASDVDRYLYSPVSLGSVTSIPDRGWTALNVTSVTSTPRTVPMSAFEEPKFGHRSTMSCGVASPWLSAIPRSNEASRHDSRIPWPAKRKAVEVDEGYDGEESASESLQSVRSNISENESSVDTSAAWMLMRMKLSVVDPTFDAVGASPGKTRVKDWFSSKVLSQEEEDGPRGVKRRRALSC